MGYYKKNRNLDIIQNLDTDNKYLLSFFSDIGNYFVLFSLKIMMCHRIIMHGIEAFKQITYFRHAFISYNFDLSTLKTGIFRLNYETLLNEIQLSELQIKSELENSPIVINNGMLHCCVRGISNRDRSQLRVIRTCYMDLPFLLTTLTLQS